MTVASFVVVAVIVGSIVLPELIHFALRRRRESKKFQGFEGGGGI